MNNTNNYGGLNESNHSYYSISNSNHNRKATNGEGAPLLPPRAPGSNTNATNVVNSSTVSPGRGPINRVPSAGSVASSNTSKGRLYPWAFHNLNILPSAHEHPPEATVSTPEEPPVTMVQVPRHESPSTPKQDEDFMSNAGTLTTPGTPNILYFWAPPPTVSPAVPPLHYFMEPPPSTPNHEPPKRRKKKYRRNWRRRLFLILTEPDSSIVSAIFYALLIFTIFLSNIIMMMETMDWFQDTPATCDICGNDHMAGTNDDTYLYTNSSNFQHEYPSGVECHCAPVSNDFIILITFSQ